MSKAPKPPHQPIPKKHEKQMANLPPKPAYWGCDYAKVGTVTGAFKGGLVGEKGPEVPPLHVNCKSEMVGFKPTLKKVDLVPKEISLVDKPANAQPFVIDSLPQEAKLDPEQKKLLYASLYGSGPASLVAAGQSMGKSQVMTSLSLAELKAAIEKDQEKAMLLGKPVMSSLQVSKGPPIVINMEGTDFLSKELVHEAAKKYLSKIMADWVDVTETVDERTPEEVAEFHEKEESLWQST